MTFLFNDEKHEYTLDGKRLTGVTTILSVIAKPALIQWAANQAIDYIKAYCLKNENEKYYVVQEKELEEARTAHIRKKDSAATKGTTVHEQVETYVNSCIHSHDGNAFIADVEEGQHQLSKFIDWAVENKVRFLESEKRVYSREHWFAGTVDLVLEIDGKVWIGDIKTSNAIYDTHFFQTAGYQIALEEMDDLKDVEGHIIIQLTRDGRFNTQRSYGIERNKQAFLSALNIYRAKEDIKHQLTNKTWKK